MNYLFFVMACLLVTAQAAPAFNLKVSGRGSQCTNVVLNQPACVVLTYIDSNTLSASLTFAGLNIYSGNISINGQSPICGSALGFKVCFEFNATPVSNGDVNVCTVVKATAPFIGTSSFNLGCFDV